MEFSENSRQKNCMLFLTTLTALVLASTGAGAGAGPTRSPLCGVNSPAGHYVSVWFMDMNGIPATCVMVRPADDALTLDARGWTACFHDLPGAMPHRSSTEQ